MSIAAVLGAGLAVPHATAQSGREAVWSVSGPAALTAREPVVATVVVDNRSPVSMTLDFGANQVGNFVVTTKSPDGVEHNRRLPLKDGFQRVGTVSVAAGQQYTQYLLLNDWATFDQVGTYEVSIQLLGQPKASSGRTLAALPTMRLQTTIGPRDEIALRATCLRLAETITTSDDVETRLFAARAVAAISDPIAVPCIEGILEKSERDDSVLLPALRRIGTDDAISALQTAALSTNQDRADLARDALGRLKTGQRPEEPPKD